MAADFHHSEGFVMGLMSVGALGVPGGLLRAGMRAHALRVLGMVALLGMLSACSAPTKEGGAGQGTGAVAAAQETPRGRYVRRVYDEVMKKWNLYRTRIRNDGGRRGLYVEFDVNPQGKAENIHVHNHRETNEDVTRFAVKSIQEAKIPPMPADVISSPEVKKKGGMGFNFLVYHPSSYEGSSASRGWVAGDGARRAKNGNACRGGEEPVSVNLTTRESGVRQAVKPQPGTPPAKGGRASGGVKTTVKLTSTPKERYIQRVTQAVEKKWQKYRMMELAGITYGSLRVVFYVNKQGQVEDPRVVDDKYSYRALTLFTLRAIKDADIPRMPAEVYPSLPMNDPERLKIEYNVLIY